MSCISLGIGSAVKQARSTAMIITIPYLKLGLCYLDILHGILQGVEQDQQG